MRMKRLFLAAFLFLLFATASRAQNTPAGDFALGYSHFHIIKGFTIPMDGASNSFAFNANHWLGVVSDLGVYHGHGNGLTGETYTFGPRFSYRRLNRLVPFTQALVGGANFSGQIGGVTGGSGNHFTFGVGGGADLLLGRSGKMALRPQMEYFDVRVNGSTLNNVRLGVAFVYRIGAK